MVVPTELHCSNPNLVCKLEKSLYGLKASKAIMECQVHISFGGFWLQAVYG